MLYKNVWKMKKRLQKNLQYAMLVYGEVGCRKALVWLHEDVRRLCNWKAESTQINFKNVPLEKGDVSVS